MSGRHPRGRRRRRRGPVKRVVRGLADAFGVPRGVVIAVFVVGFVFIPLLSLLAFLVALYWVNDPDRTRRHVDSFFDGLRRGNDRIRRGTARPRRNGVDSAADQEPRKSPPPPIDSTALARRFERIERRARAIEGFVASEEFRLNREFRRMERE